MKPAPFEYLAPESLSSALEIIAEYGDEAKLLAGGQSLIPAMNFRLVQPTVMVDLNKLTDLSYVKNASSGELLIGSMTRHRQLEYDPLVKNHSPLIHETMPHIAHAQIRNRGTIGGSLAHADPAAELPVLLVALDGRVRMKSRTGERWVNSDDFFQGIFTTALSDTEIIVEISIPKMPEGTGYSFVEFARRKGDYALLGVAALVRLDANDICRQARIVYLNAGDSPVKAQGAASLLLDEQRSDELLETVATNVEQELSLTGTIHASVPYLRHLSRVLTVRALKQAFQRASQIDN
jgi:carbon-monoxide dehydrogenase medium subunit